jgi:FkbM family methyltransferase
VLAYHKRLNRLDQMEIVAAAVTNVTDVPVPFVLVNGGLSFRNSLTTAADDVPYLALDAKSKIEVASVSLDNFCRQSGLIPNLIKIDVEGADLLVLQGAERILTECSPIVILGVHPYWLPKPQHPADIANFLHRHGYEIRDEHVVRFDDTYLADYLCTPTSTVDLKKSGARPSRTAI